MWAFIGRAGRIKYTTIVTKHAHIIFIWFYTARLTKFEGWDKAVKLIFTRETDG